MLGVSECFNITRFQSGIVRLFRWLMVRFGLSRGLLEIGAETIFEFSSFIVCIW